MAANNSPPTAEHKAARNASHVSTSHVWPPAASQKHAEAIGSASRVQSDRRGKRPPHRPTPQLPRITSFHFLFHFPHFRKSVLPVAPSHARTPPSVRAAASSPGGPKGKKLTLTIYMKRPHASLVQFGFLSMHGESRLIHGKRVFFKEVLPLVPPFPSSSSRSVFLHRQTQRFVFFFPSLRLSDKQGHIRIAHEIIIGW